MTTNRPTEAKQEPHRTRRTNERNDQRPKTRPATLTFWRSPKTQDYHWNLTQANGRKTATAGEGYRRAKDATNGWISTTGHTPRPNTKIRIKTGATAKATHARIPPATAGAIAKQLQDAGYPAHTIRTDEPQDSTQNKGADR